MKWSELSPMEKDALVAEKVMGLVEYAAYAGSHKATLGWGKPGADFQKGELFPCPKYSSDMRAAFEVFEKITKFFEHPWAGLVYNGKRKCWVCHFNQFNQGDGGLLKREAVAAAETAMDAICIAALRAVGSDIDFGSDSKDLKI